MKIRVPHFGIGLRQLNRFLRKLGGRVIKVRGTGEVRYAHPATGLTARGNGRGKDAPANLVLYVRHLLFDPPQRATRRHRSWSMSPARRRPWSPRSTATR